MIEPIEMNVDFSTQDTEMNVEADMNCRVEIPLPIASATTLGGIKVGENLSITEDGTLSVDESGTQEEIEQLQEDVAQLENEIDTKADADDVDQLKNALTTKAEQDGVYPDFTAGQMLSKVEASDSVPYNFRAVGQDATLEYTDAIVGGSVAFNQLVRNGDFADGTQHWSIESGVTATAADNVVSITSSVVNNGINQTITFNSNHIYLMAFDVSASSVCEVRGVLWGNGHFSLAIEANTSKQKAIKIAPFNGDTIRTALYIYATEATTIYVSNVILIDLTAMFGTTLADYIYSLEQANAGAGVAWFKKLFPKDYYPYDAGSIQSVQGLSQHVTVGFNQWDEEWEVGSINENGQNSDWNSVWRSKNYIPVISGGAYYLKATTLARIFYYDAQKNFIRYDADPGNEIIVMPDNCCFVRIRSNTTSNAYNHDICINLSDPAKNGTYEPYQKRTYPLDDSLTLRGILKLDTSNNLYADGDRYLPDGTVQRRYGMVDLGTLSWSSASTGISGRTRFVSQSVRSNCKAVVSNNIANIVSRYSAVKGDTGLGQNVDKVAWIDNYKDINIVDSTYGNDATAFKTAMSGVYLVYELATPTTEEADPYTVPQIVDPNGTEEYVSTSIVPVGHESRYPLDIAGRLDKILTMPTANGTYTLRATVNNGAVTYAWVST